MKCANCGDEIPEGMAFCGTCGTKVPEMKSCIKCGKQLPLSMMFCGYCGTSQAETETTAGSGISLGDKNVVSGDIIGNKQDTFVTGNATIINDADETKKVAKCHVCGRNVMRLDGYDCPVCGEFTCKDCYVPELGKCTTCRDNSGNEKESAYMQALERILGDGRVDLAERKELMNLQSQLGISAGRAIELENIVKNNQAAKKTAGEADSLSSFDKISFDKAVNYLYEEGNAKEALSLIEPLYKKYSLNGEVFTLYINTLAKLDPSRVLNEIKSLQADELCTNLVEIDIASKNKNFRLLKKSLSMLNNTGVIQCF